METQSVDVRDPEVLDLVRALDAELAGAGYTEDQMFGYSPEQLHRGSVHLVGVRIDGRLAGIGGVELQDEGVAELKRMHVAPQQRDRGAADAILAVLVEHAALGFYRRHGFTEVPRFPPYVASETSICMQRELA